MKKQVKLQASKREKLEATFNVIYTYSHQKFYEYLKTNEVRVIFKAIFQNTSVNEFIENHDTLRIAANREKYTQHIDKLLSK